MNSRSRRLVPPRAGLRGAHHRRRRGALLRAQGLRLRLGPLLLLRPLLRPRQEQEPAQAGPGPPGRAPRVRHVRSVDGLHPGREVSGDHGERGLLQHHSAVRRGRGPRPVEGSRGAHGRAKLGFRLALAFRCVPAQRRAPLSCATFLCRIITLHFFSLFARTGEAAARREDGRRDPLCGASQRPGSRPHDGAQKVLARLPHAAPVNHPPLFDDRVSLRCALTRLLSPGVARHAPLLYRPRTVPLHGTDRPCLPGARDLRWRARWRRGRAVGISGESYGERGGHEQVAEAAAGPRVLRDQRLLG